MRVQSRLGRYLLPPEFHLAHESCPVREPAFGEPCRFPGPIRAACHPRKLPYGSHPIPDVSLETGAISSCDHLSLLRGLLQVESSERNARIPPIVRTILATAFVTSTIWWLVIHDMQETACKRGLDSIWSLLVQNNVYEAIQLGLKPWQPGDLWDFRETAEWTEYVESEERQSRVRYIANAFMNVRYQ